MNVTPSHCLLASSVREPRCARHFRGWRTAGACIALPLTGLLAPHHASADATTIEVDLGSIDHIGAFYWNETLEYRWDADFSLGGIVGRPNATVTPRIEIPIPFVPNIVIPAVTADTRTGARFSGNIAGGIGLDFFADFSASGLSPGNMFDFNPTVTAPSAIPVGDFFRLSTSIGLQDDPTFTADRIQLPSFEAGMDLLFDLAINGKVEGGLFPVIPYGSAPITMDEPWNVNQSLVDFRFDLNPGAPQPPALTFLKGTYIEQSFEVVDPDLSSMSIQLSYGPPTNRIDLGEIEIINPFGADESIIGGVKPNLTINTSMDASSVGFSFETPLLRMGLDLDGIAGYLVTGAFGYPTSAVTRLDAEIDGVGGVYLELLDIKYGPEIGYRERVDIRPDLQVTLDFDTPVTVRNSGGFDVVEQFTGLWSDLPELSLMGDDPVEVTVRFDALVGEQAKRGAFFLTDYLQFTLLQGGVNVLDTLEMSFPPLLQLRTGLLGLLGQVELDVFRATHEIAPIELGGMTSSFWLYPQADDRLLFWSSQADDNPAMLNRWARLADKTTPDMLADKVLILGRGDADTVHTGQLTAMTLTDHGSGPFYDDLLLPPETISAAELRLPAGSEVMQSGMRLWQLQTVRNDGLYESDGITAFAQAGTLHITGTGDMVFTDLVRIGADTLIHDEGHTMLFQGAGGMVTTPQGIDPTDRPLDVTSELINKGTIIFDHTNATVAPADRLVNAATGSLLALNGSVVSFDTPRIEHSGLLAAIGANSELQFASTLSLVPMGSQGVFHAGDGGAIIFDAPPFILDRSPVIGELWQPELGRTTPLKQVTFHAAEGGLIRFDGSMEHGFDVLTRFVTAPGGEIVLNGISFPPFYARWDEVDAYREMASDFMEVINHGTLAVASGSNSLYYRIPPPVGSPPGGEPPPEPAEPTVSPLNLVNTGEVIIHAGASFSFQVAIENFIDTGAVFDLGTWTLLGSDTGWAYLGIEVVQVSNENTYLGTVFLGSENPIEDFDTRMVVNASNITLSNRAIFPYLNTIEENRGRLTLQNNHHFTAAGDLLNRGEIRIESGATLQMPDARMTVDEGSLFIDGAAGASLIGADHTDILGGAFTNALAAGPVDIAGHWTVRDKWLGEDSEGNDIIRPASVSFGEAHIGQIFSTGRITLDGSEAAMHPLSGLTHNHGWLTLTGGNVLTLEHDLHNAETGRLEVLKAAQLLIDGILTSDGALTVGPEGYLRANGINLAGGSIMINGVVDAAHVVISEDVAVSGSTLLTGSLLNDGHLAVGSSTGIMEIFGGFHQSGTGAIEFEIFGQIPGESHDQLILHADSAFDGILGLVFGDDGFQPRFGRQWLLVDVRQSSEPEVPVRTVEWLLEAGHVHVAGLGPFTGDFDPSRYKWQADDLLLGGRDDMAIYLSFGAGGAGNLAVYSVPEPASLAMLAIGGLVMLHRRRR